jgi:hypothetical protein
VVREGTTGHDLAHGTAVVREGTTGHDLAHGTAMDVQEGSTYHPVVALTIRSCSYFCNTEFPSFIYFKLPLSLISIPLRLFQHVLLVSPPFLHPNIFLSSS